LTFKPSEKICKVVAAPAATFKDAKTFEGIVKFDPTVGTYTGEIKKGDFIQDGGRVYECITDTAGVCRSNQPSLSTQGWKLTQFSSSV